MIDVTLKNMNFDGNIGTTIGTNFHTSATGIYVGGDPVGLQSGLVIGLSIDDDAEYVGVMFNNSVIDSNVGAGTVGTTTDLTQAEPVIVAQGGSKAILSKGTRSGVADTRHPFVTGVIWTTGDSMYINAGTNPQSAVGVGLWINTQASAGTLGVTVFGSVHSNLGSGVDGNLEVEFY